MVLWLILRGCCYGVGAVKAGWCSVGEKGESVCPARVKGVVLGSPPLHPSRACSNPLNRTWCCKALHSAGFRLLLSPALSDCTPVLIRHLG